MLAVTSLREPGAGRCIRATVFPPQHGRRGRPKFYRKAFSSDLNGVKGIIRVSVLGRVTCDRLAHLIGRQKFRVIGTGEVYRPVAICESAFDSKFDSPCRRFILEG